MLYYREPPSFFSTALRSPKWCSKDTLPGASSQTTGAPGWIAAYASTDPPNVAMGALRGDALATLGYVVPVSGKGLWSTLYGYLAAVATFAGLAWVWLAPLLARAGFLLRKPRPGRPWLGAPMDTASGGVIVSGYPMVHGSLYGAGIDRGAVLVSIGGRAITDMASVDAALEALQAGRVVQVEWMDRGVRRSGPMTLAENPALEVVAYESAGMPVTAEMRAFREAWLGPRAAR